MPTNIIKFRIAISKPNIKKEKYIYDFTDQEEKNNQYNISLHTKTKLIFYQSQEWQVSHQECGSYSLDADQHEKIQYQAAEIK